MVNGTPRVAACVKDKFLGFGASEESGVRMNWAWEPDVVKDWVFPDVLNMGVLRRLEGPSWGVLVELICKV